MRRERSKQREEGYLRTSRSCFPTDQHLRLFLSPFAHGISFLLYFRVRVTMKEAYSWKIFFLVSTIPRNREGTVEEEETRSGLCRSFDVHKPDDYSKGSSFSKQGLFASW